MKVMHLISGGETGGSRTHVLSLINELQKSIPVTLVCLTAGDFFHQGQAMGLDVRTAEQKKRYQLNTVREIARLISEEKFGLLHCHGPRANFFGALVKKLRRIPAVTTIHSDYLQDFQHSFYKQKVYATFNSLSLKTLDGYFAVSDKFKENLISRGFPADKITVIYNGLDFAVSPVSCPREDFLAAHSLPIPPEARVAGILARLHPIKGHEIFLAGARLILDAFPDTHFIIAGDGEERENLLSLRDRLGLAGRVHFIGHINDTSNFFSAIDINTLTSYSESFPYALLEGALQKKPAVSSDVGGIGKLVINGETGYVFPAGDETEFARRMLVLLQDSNLCQTLGVNLHQHARDNFSLARLAEIHLQAYQHYGGEKSDETFGQ